MTLSDETRTELRAAAKAADLHGIQDCAVGMSRGYRSYVYATKPDVILALLDEIDELRAERDVERRVADLADAAQLDWKARLRRAEAVVDRVRGLHDQYLPAAVDYVCCAHCNIGGNYIPWPCPTILTLEGAEQ